MKARLEWAKLHENWNEEQWNRVLFCDESSFTVRPVSFKKRIWRKANRSLNYVILFLDSNLDT